MSEAIYRLLYLRKINVVLEFSVPNCLTLRMLMFFLSGEIEFNLFLFGLL